MLVLPIRLQVFPNNHCFQITTKAVKGMRLHHCGVLFLALSLLACDPAPEKPEQQAAEPRDRNKKLTRRRLIPKAEVGAVGGRKLVKERPGGTSNGIGWPLPRCECSGSQREA